MTLTVRSHRARTIPECCCLGRSSAPLAAYAGYSQSSPAPPSSPAAHAIAVQTELVVLPVRVIDVHGDFVSGLSPDNFRVYEDGRLATN